MCPACLSVYQDSCSNKIKKEVLSPGKTLKAVIFERTCSMTTESSTEISILPVDNSLSNETGNVFIYKTGYLENESADGKKANVEVNWIAEKQIIVAFDDFTTTKVGRMTQQVEKVKIIYDKREAVLNQNFK
jgi:hypothetical protein